MDYARLFYCIIEVMDKRPKEFFQLSHLSVPVILTAILLVTFSLYLFQPERVYQASHGWDLMLGMILVGASLFLILVWGVVLWSANVWRRKLMQSNAELRSRQLELQKLNQHLDEEVAARTAQLEESQKQLLQSQKMESMGTLAGGIAHDLNNQLTPLMGYLDLVIKDTPPSDARRELLAGAEQASRNCAEVVQRLMNISRSSNQKKVWLKPDVLLAETKQLFPKILPLTVRTEVICDIQI